MTTRLERPVRRKTSAAIRDQGLRRLVVTLYPGDVLGLRPERTRREEYLPLSAVYELAVKARLREEAKAKKKAKAEKAKARRKR